MDEGFVWEHAFYLIDLAEVTGHSNYFDETLRERSLMRHVQNSSSYERYRKRNEHTRKDSRRKPTRDKREREYDPYSHSGRDSQRPKQQTREIPHNVFMNRASHNNNNHSHDAHYRGDQKWSAINPNNNKV